MEKEIPRCPDHTDLVREVAEMKALQHAHAERGDRLEGLLRVMDTKLDEHGTELVSLRKDVEYHSKFWGAVAGLIGGIVSGFIGGK